VKLNPALLSLLPSDKQTLIRDWSVANCSVTVALLEGVTVELIVDKRIVKEIKRGDSLLFDAEGNVIEVKKKPGKEKTASTGSNTRGSGCANMKKVHQTFIVDKY
jgi:hypothetical protein